MQWDIFNKVFVRCGKIYFSTVYRYFISLLGSTSLCPSLALLSGDRQLSSPAINDTRFVPWFHSLRNITSSSFGRSSAFHHRVIVSSIPQLSSQAINDSLVLCRGSTPFGPSLALPSGDRQLSSPAINDTRFVPWFHSLRNITSSSFGRSSAFHHRVIVSSIPLP